MKAIFISQAVLNRNNGGGQYIASLIGLMRSIVGEGNLTVVSLPDEYDRSEHVRREDNLIVYEAEPSKKQMAENLLCGCPRWVSADLFDKIMERIRNETYSFVFLGFSTYEYLIKRIKKETELPVFVMYHGIVPNTKKLRLENASLARRIKTYLSYQMVYKRERVNVRLADCNIVLNAREGGAFYRYYKKEPDLYLPIFIADRFSSQKGENPGYKGFSLLFVGSHFGPNISGLKWFAEKVMPFVDEGINLYVVGQGMEALKKESFSQKENICIIGEVQRLEPWYYFADLVVEPIFSGDGMKTKTAEAMMFGKTILGSEEAFCGYEGLGRYQCDTASEFIERINREKKNGAPLFNREIREIYLRKYSEEAVLDKMRSAVDRYVNHKESLTDS